MSGKASWPHLLRKVPSPPFGLLEGFQEINALKTPRPVCLASRRSLVNGRWDTLKLKVTPLRTGRARWCTQGLSPRWGSLPHGAAKHPGFLFVQVGTHTLRC